jgi:hypothetical protein
MADAQGLPRHKSLRVFERDKLIRLELNRSLVESNQILRDDLNGAAETRDGQKCGQAWLSSEA